MNFTAYTQQTIKMIAENRLPHAIIVETESMADALFYVTSCAKAILKTDHPENHPDFFAFSPTGKVNVIKIEVIRELIDCVQKTPNAGNQKVFVIFEANRLNKNAANALLKTLEEPPPDTTLFLITHSKIFLLPTIISRCVLHHLPKNSIAIFPVEFSEWAEQLDIFLKKLFPICNATNVLEIFSLLEMLSRSLEKFTKNGDGVENVSMKDIQRILLDMVIEKVWNIFHFRLSPHFIERMVKIILKSSTILAVNGSFLHVMENALLQIYQISCWERHGSP